jgi:cytochrome c oxidase subunit 2
MNTFPKAAFFIMRISVGIVFLMFGVGKLSNDIWAQTIRAMDIFQHLPWDVNCTVVMIGISEIVTGTCLVIGLYARFFAAVAALQLAMILVLVKLQETRDIGLWGAAVYMALAGQGSWGMDEYLRKWKDGSVWLKKCILLAVVCVPLALLGSLVLCKVDVHGGHHEGKSMVVSVLSGKLENGVRMIDVTASKYKFEPDPIVVRAGEHVRLVLTSADTDHGFAIGELNINVSIPAGQSKTFEFVAPGKGAYTVHCSVYCGPGHKSMSGAFTVVE